MAAGSIRARVRAEMIDEIKAIARRHLATDGANLSLRAVARDMGMVSSALYRYFPSRDDLLTALIIDAYNALGDAAETADAAVADQADLRGRWQAICHAVRDWALANPAEYALLYGSPVPGYAAPVDTVGGPPHPGDPGRHHRRRRTRRDAGQRSADGLSAQVRADLSATLASFSPALTPALLARGMPAWSSIFGAVSFELFGQYNNVVHARREFFDHQMRRIAEQVGLPSAG